MDRFEKANLDKYVSAVLPSTSSHGTPGRAGQALHYAKLSEKRMHFVREKRDKPPGRGFHAGKRLSDKRDKRDKRDKTYLSAVC
jgi:hypothetical protein